MQITCSKGDILQSQADLIVIGVYENEDWDNPFLTRVNELINGKLTKLAKTQEFSGKIEESLLLSAKNGIASDYLLILGLGSQTANDLIGFRDACGIAVQTARRLGSQIIAIEFFGEDSDTFQATATAQAMAESFLIASYNFDVYKTKKDLSTITAVTIIGENSHDVKKAKNGIEKARLIADGVTVARDLVNTPAQDMTPTRLSQVAKEITQISKGSVKIKLFDKEKCKKKNMNAFLAVAQGSNEPPFFIELIYKPSKPAKKIIALVGKGITFDSGGLSLKPGQHMETMKCDMAGAATVLGVFSTLARLNPRVEIHGYIAATENMPSGNAIRPGDIVCASNNTTIEIANTDAEGRLTLADAFIQAQKIKPDYLVDLATLTGACMVALGEEVAGLMSNNRDFATTLLEKAQTAGELLWELPLVASYDKLIKSEVADVKNIPSVPYGGVLTAGLFLQRFIGPNQIWAHIDIAGPAFAEREFASYLTKGATGYGVRTLIKWIESM